MKKCILWGMGADYEALLNQVLFEIYKGNIEVVAIVCSENDRYCSKRDGFDIITKNELGNIEFDYIIVTSTRFFREIKQEAMDLGINEKRIISGTVFHLPRFDFQLYQNLIENPITILADDCWGGYVYNQLGLSFTTPLINILWDRDEYAKFISDPLFYLNTELKMVREGNLHDGIFPIGSLGDEKRKIEMQFVHNWDFKEAKEQWDRRKQRINEQNLFIKMGFSVGEKKDEWLTAFKNLNCKKILFYNGDTDIKEIINTDRYIWHNRKSNRIDIYDYNEYLRGYYLNDMDLLRMLNGEEGYAR